MLQNKKLGRRTHSSKLVRVHEERHQLLKAKAVEEGVTMSFLLNEIIQEYFQIGFRPKDYQDNGLLNHEEFGETV